jgi:hypothetical protein
MAAPRWKPRRRGAVARSGRMVVDHGRFRLMVPFFGIESRFMELCERSGRRGAGEAAVDVVGDIFHPAPWPGVSRPPTHRRLYSLHGGPSGWGWVARTPGHDNLGRIHLSTIQCLSRYPPLPMDQRPGGSYWLCAFLLHVRLACGAGRAAGSRGGSIDCRRGGTSRQHPDDGGVRRREGGVAWHAARLADGGGALRIEVDVGFHLGGGCLPWRYLPGG